MIIRPAPDSITFKEEVTQKRVVTSLWITSAIDGEKRFYCADCALHMFGDTHWSLDDLHQKFMQMVLLRKVIYVWQEESEPLTRQQCDFCIRAPVV